MTVPILGCSRADSPSGRVLVVDDEEFVRRTLAMFLNRAGQEAVTAGCGEQAMELLASRQAFDLLVTDQSMPGMSGIELIAAAARSRPSLPALLVTGYDVVGDLSQLPWRIPVLRKPVGRAAFLAEVERLTGAKASADQPS